MSSAAPAKMKLGTFIGVFTPTLLTILGVIMYLRLGWVVGNAGLWGTIAIVLIANAITALTAASMSSLATNMQVGVGGAYFLISRSFGKEIGGAIGIPLFLSQVLSLTLYAYGLAEIPTLFYDFPPIVIQIMACSIIIGVTAFAARSTEFALKAQIPVMVLIGLSLVAFFMGIDWEVRQVQQFGPWPDASFWEVFAVFFPAVTGVLAGLSLSGDLKDPSRSIPIGVGGAVAVGTVVYLILPIGLAFAAPEIRLRTESLLWTDIAFGGTLMVLPGMVGAVLSSAVGSVLGAPRTLQALAEDKLFNFLTPFAVVDEETGEPMMGLAATGGLALGAALVLPDLNAVASGVTVFFLTTYGALNAVAFLETVIGDPSFRPTIRVHWSLSLLGALGCILTMFLISPLACFVAVGVEIAIGYILSRRSLEATWGDARTGMLLTITRQSLIQLRASRFDARNWRPHILVLTTNIERCFPSLGIAEILGQHRGIVTLVHLLEGDLEDHVNPSVVSKEDAMLLAGRGFDAFAELSIVPDTFIGATTVAQANGFAGLNSNTVLVQLDYGEEELAKLLGLTRQMEKLMKSCVICHPSTNVFPEKGRDRNIVVWWAGQENNGDLMLLLAHFLSQSREWSGCRVVLKTIVDDADESRSREAELNKLVPALRMDIAHQVLVRPDGVDVTTLLVTHSQHADLVFLGLRITSPGEEEEYGKRLYSLIEQLPFVLLVRNAGHFRGSLL